MKKEVVFQRHGNRPRSEEASVGPRPLRVVMDQALSLSLFQVHLGLHPEFRDDVRVEFIMN